MISDFRVGRGSKMTPPKIGHYRVKIDGHGRLGVKNDLKNRTPFMYVPCYEKSDKDKINVWLKREERSK